MLNVMKVKVLVTQSCLTLCNPMDFSLWGNSAMGFSRQEHWSGGSRSLCQGVFLTQGLSPDLQRYRQILYRLSHQRRVTVWI